MSLPSDISATLASGDKEAAKRLAGVIAGQMARGECHGFESDLAALRKLAGTDQPLGKLAKGLRKNFDGYSLEACAPYLEKALPSDLQARLDTTLAALERAETPVEKAAAEVAGKTLLDEIATRRAIMSAQADVRKVGLGELTRRLS